MFDYKLRVGEFQYFNWSNCLWETKEDILNIVTIGEKLKIELAYLQKLLDKVGIENELKIYPYFSLGYISDTNFQAYVKSPIQVYLPSVSTPQKKIFLEYDINDKKFVLATVRENEVYQQFFLDHISENKTKHDVEWESVFEYISQQKFNLPENLVIELWKTYKSLI